MTKQKSRPFVEDRLVIATHNPGKLREIKALLEPFGISVQSAGELNVDEPEETGDTFQANALLKAHHSAKATGLPALADDSGLSVTALDGAPGIYSARWAGPDKDFTLAMEKVEEGLAGKEDRSARFICALALAWPDGEEIVFEGKVEGHLTWPARGNQGFGYDPIFIPKGHDITFAEMEPVRKHAMSHRADAFTQLVSACFKTRGA